MTLLSADQEFVPIYRRSPFQVAVLMFVTGGIYIFWWAYLTRVWCAGTLERRDQPILKTVALIVPILNILMLFEIGKLIEGCVFRAELPPPRYNLGLACMGATLFNIIARNLPVPFDSMTLLTFVPVALIHAHTYRAERAISGDAAPAMPFNRVQWIVVALGLVFNAITLTDIYQSGNKLEAFAVIAAVSSAFWIIYDRGRRSDRSSAILITP